MRTPITPRIVTFDTEELLQDHAEKLNQIGTSPDVAIIDSRGIAVLACVTAPGGDGWDFAYYLPAEDGFMHCCNCSECGRSCSAGDRDWKPTFPVHALVAYDLEGVEGIL